MGVGYKNIRVGCLGIDGEYAFPHQVDDHGRGGMVVTDYTNRNNLYRSQRDQARDVYVTWFSHYRQDYKLRS